MEGIGVRDHPPSELAEPAEPASLTWDKKNAEKHKKKQKIRKSTKTNTKYQKIKKNNSHEPEGMGVRNHTPSEPVEPTGLAGVRKNEENYKKSKKSENP